MLQAIQCVQSKSCNRGTSPTSHKSCWTAQKAVFTAPTSESNYLKIGGDIDLVHNKLPAKNQESTQVCGKVIVFALIL